MFRRIAVVGPCEWTDKVPVRHVLERLRHRGKRQTLMHGNYWTGVDAIVDMSAKMLGYDVEPYPVVRLNYGPTGARMERDSTLLDNGAQLVVAFALPMLARQRTHELHVLREDAHERGVPVLWVERTDAQSPGHARLYT